MSISERLGVQGTADLEDVQIPYRRRGSGQPVLFLHGGATTGDLWRDVVPMLATGYDCITPDLPLGAHRTPVADTSYLSSSGLARLVSRFIRVMDVGPVTVVANDSGGAVAQILVTTEPALVDRLVLTNCDAFENYPPGPLRVVHRLRWVPGLIPAFFAVSAKSRLLRAAFYRSAARRRIEPDVMAAYTVGAHRADIRRQLAQFFINIRAAELLAAAEKLPGFGAPALVAWGGDDLYFPVEHGRRLASLLPNGHFELIAHARTFLPEDQPVVLAELILRFLDAHASGEHRAETHHISTSN